MAKLKEITYGLGTTVKVRDYEYAKPHIAVTMTIDPTDDEEAVFQELTTVVREELKKETKVLLKQLREH